VRANPAPQPTLVSVLTRLLSRMIVFATVAKDCNVTDLLSSADYPFVPDVLAAIGLGMPVETSTLFLVSIFFNSLRTGARTTSANR